MTRNLFGYPNILTVLALTLAVGCKGEDNQLVSLDVIEPGDECPNGGLAIHTGEDEDEDGVLDAGEISDSQIVCDGVAGDPGEDGHEALISTTEIPRGDEECPYGGVQIDIGLDNGDGGGTAGDGILQPGEIDDTEVVCDGAPSFDLTELDHPGGTPGAFTVDLSGGDASNNDGGDGGDALIGGGEGYGLPGGHIKIYD
ncbi:MAG: hypothetical protein JRJ84_23815, partial [Deltaproteobacteria bacterium]|nr:hypothetical protein [Deltaproteobacteria bacterium]